jgi:hypothetical protein
MDNKDIITGFCLTGGTLRIISPNPVIIIRAASVVFRGMLRRRFSH